MRHIDKIQEALEQNNGVITASQVTAANIPRHYLKKIANIKYL